MPQTPIPSNIAVKAGARAPLLLDAQGNVPVTGTQADKSLLTANGNHTTLNVTAAAVISAAAKRLCKVIIVVPGSGSGAFTLNDVATVGAAAQANVIWTMPYNSALNIAGQVINVDAPLATGLVVSAVPGAGSPQINVVWN